MAWPLLRAILTCSHHPCNNLNIYQAMHHLMYLQVSNLLPSHIPNSRCNNLVGTLSSTYSLCRLLPPDSLQCQEHPKLRYPQLIPLLLLVAVQHMTQSSNIVILIQTSLISDESYKSAETASVLLKLLIE